MRAIRLSDEFLAQVDAWSDRQEDKPGRSEAIRRLVELGLAGATGGRAKKSATSSKSSDLAGKQIDRMTDKSASAEDQATRKRRLLRGPSEFRDVRQDRKKKP